MHCIIMRMTISLHRVEIGVIPLIGLGQIINAIISMSMFGYVSNIPEAPLRIVIIST